MKDINRFEYFLNAIHYCLWLGDMKFGDFMRRVVNIRLSPIPKYLFTNKKNMEMRQYLYLCLFTVLLISVSCDNHCNKELKPNVEITSNELRSVILEYDSIIQPRIEKKNYILSISEKMVNDSVTQFIFTMS